jgi:hypothetical protein
VQKGFYLVPSLPYFAIGLSIFIAPKISYFKTMNTSKKNANRFFLLFSVVLIAFSIGFSLMQIGKTQRDREMLHDVHAIGNAIPGKSAITVNQDIATASVLECYFIRYYDISLYIDEPKEYLMVKKTIDHEVHPEFEKLKIETKIYDLYVRKKQINN